jgi:RNA polymerase sigma factor (sigma-70 family)
MQELAQLLSQRRHTFLRLAKRYAPADVEAEDCVQDAAILALRHIHQFEGRAQFATWFGAIVRNCALMRGRRKREQVSLDDFADNKRTFGDLLLDRGFSPEKIAELKQGTEILNRLRPRVASLLRLVYIEQLQTKEIAERLNIPLGTAKARISRARTELRRAGRKVAHA